MIEIIEWVMLVEVEKNQRVRCDYPDCKHSVYRRIHVLRYPDASYKCIGSGCFKKLSEDRTVRINKAPSVDYFKQGKTLTQAQRQQLLDNRIQLLDRLLAEGLQAQQPISTYKSADITASAIQTKGTSETEQIAEIINISKASSAENYLLLKQYAKFNPQINYASFPQGEKYSRALDMVQRKYRDLGTQLHTSDIRFQREVQLLIDDMVDYNNCKE